MTLSVVIICKNAAATIKRTLESVVDFEEVIVYDNGSIDGTQNIANSFNNVKLFEGPFWGFGPTKKYAVSLATNNWILSLDADEELSQKLRINLHQWQKDPQTVGRIRRENLMLGEAIKHSGWGNDWLIRLFHRQHTNFNNAMVHEQVVPRPGSQVVSLDGTIIHHAVTDLSQFLEKVNRYSSIRAEEANKKLPVIWILVRSIFAFTKTYFIRLGMLDGWRGLVISVSNANGVFWKYIKAYAINYKNNNEY